MYVKSVIPILFRKIFFESEFYSSYLVKKNVAIMNEIIKLIKIKFLPKTKTYTLVRLTFIANQ